MRLEAVLQILSILTHHLVGLLSNLIFELSREGLHGYYGHQGFVDEILGIVKLILVYKRDALNVAESGKIELRVTLCVIEEIFLRQFLKQLDNPCPNG